MIWPDLVHDRTRVYILPKDPCCKADRNKTEETLRKWKSSFAVSGLYGTFVEPLHKLVMNIVNPRIILPPPQLIRTYSPDKGVHPWTT